MLTDDGIIAPRSTPATVTSVSLSRPPLRGVCWPALHRRMKTSAAVVATSVALLSLTGCGTETRRTTVSFCKVLAEGTEKLRANVKGVATADAFGNLGAGFANSASSQACSTDWTPWRPRRFRPT